MKHYKYLLLDADGTFYDFPSCEKVAIKKLFDNYNIPLSDDNLVLYHSANSELWDLFEKGKATCDDIRIKRFIPIMNKYSLEAKSQEAGLLYCKYLSENGILYPGARECLERLKQSYKLIMITNGLKEVQYGRFEASNTTHLYDKILISEELGVQKPKKKFFTHTLDLINATESECLIIGDSLTSDIQGGINSGIDTLYLHLNKEKQEGAYTYAAASYDEILDLLIKSMREDSRL